MAKYQDGCIEITTTDSYLQIYHTTGDFFITLDYEEVGDLLRRWAPNMKLRSYFICTIRSKDFRSYDVKSVVRILRKVVKNRV